MNSVNELHQVPNINHVLQNFIYFVSTYKREQTQPTKGRPIDSYHRYNRNINQRLKEINTNLSNALTESCGEIDNICNRVRMCLTDRKYHDMTIPQTNSSSDTLDNKTVADIEEVSLDKTAKSKPSKNVKSPASTLNAKSENNEIKSLPDFTTFVLPERGLSIKHNKKVIKEFRNIVLSKKYDEKCISTMVEEIQRNIDNLSKTAVIDIKPVKEPKKNEKCIQTTEPRTPLLSQDPLPPEVYRRPGSTDLYEKLLFQIETNDSFTCFQRLMNKKLKPPKHTKTFNETSKHIKTKYKDSFFFSHKNFSRKKDHHKKITMSQGSIHANKSLKGDYKSEQTLKKRRLSNNTDRKSSITCSLGQFSLKVHNEVPNHSEMQRNNWLKVKTQQAPHRRLRCWDILDNLTERDLIPLKSEYPRKEKPQSNTVDYLKILTEESGEDAWMKLLQPKHPLEKTQSREVANTESNSQDVMSSMSKREIIHKLQPYIFGTDQLQTTEITVLPVQVVYDSKSKNFARGVSKHAFNQKCSIITMKEEQTTDRAKWSSIGSSRNVDLRPIRDKKEVKKVVVQPILPIPKTKNIPAQRKVVKSPLPTISSHDPNIESEIETKFKNVPLKDKKLWAHKYNRGPGCQLIKFIENQKTLSFMELPRHALPKAPRDRGTEGKSEKFSSKAHHKRVLSHLKDLKQKNYAVQHNIENAINVIEEKLAGILSSPDSHDSSEAFNHMEKEITSVLGMIKCTADSKEKLHAIQETTAIEEDFDSISKELFKKLEKILESDSLKTPESISSHSSSTRSKQKTTRKTSRTTHPAEKPIAQQDSPKGNNETTEDPERDENLVPLETIDENSHGDFSRNMESCVAQNSTPEPPFSMEESKEPTPLEPLEDESSINDDVANESITDRPMESIDNDMPVIDEDAAEHQELVPVKTPPKFIEKVSDEPNLPQHINKIIRRVEDIYKELDEIQTSDGPNVSVFQEKLEIFEVSSEEFLTPFMQAVKDKRKNPSAQSMNDTNRSPSYYNVLNFLESLNDIQEDERVVEVYTAIMCHFPLICEEAKVLHEMTLEQSLVISQPEKPSCLKKSNSEGKSKGKKVTFNITKEDKNIQADVCCSPIESQQESFVHVESEKNNLNKEINISQDCFFEQHPPVNKGGSEIETNQTDNTELQEDKTDSNVEESIRSQYFLETDPQIKVFYDEQTGNIPRVVIKHKVCESDFNKNMTTNEDQKANPNIVVFREISEVSDLLTPLKNLEHLKKSTQRFNNIQIIKKVNKMYQHKVSKKVLTQEKSKELLLKSIYAIVYILMFTALNLDYICL